MTEYGYHLSSEEHGPGNLVSHARRAEAVGFDFALVSDHYHPWLERQGHAPFVWSTLGSIAEATDELDVGTGVTCPLQRIHPAVIAQAAATTARLFDGRFFLGVGTGENLNEHVLGDRWPPHHVRLEMLQEAIAVIRRLWTGEETNHRGEHYTVENARLFDLPERPPPIPVAGAGPETARAAGRFGDGFVCTVPDESLVEAYETGGGDGHRYGKVPVCWAESEAEALETAHGQWPNELLAGSIEELRTPAHFEQAAALVDEDDVAETFVLGPDPEPYVERIEEYADAGFDRVCLHQVGPNQEAFFEFYESEVAPSLS